MRARSKALVSGLTTTVLVTGAWLAVPTVASAGVSSGAPVVINEVYGGGGNTGATYKQDFIELYNRSGSAVNLAGWSVQYASATGTSYATTALTGTLPAGTHFVVREAQGTGGTTDVPSDVTGTIALSGTAGKVALVNSTSALSCAADCDGNAAVVDFVGFGTTANDFAGTGPAPAPSNTNSVSRNASHDNTANNAADFTAGAPSPVACGSACTATPPPPVATEKTIAEIQGPGAQSPLVGSTVTTKGIVTAAYPNGGFKGYYLQTPGTGGPQDPADTTSDAVFAFQSTGSLPAAVQVGKYLQVTGSVTEFFGMTEINVDAANVVDLGAAPAPVTATTTAGWPTTDAGRESLEGMLYRPTGDFTVTNTFGTNQYGEVGLASGTKPLIQRTEVEKPGPAASSPTEADNAARAVTLDDGSSINFLATSGGLLVNGNLTPPYVSQAAPVRVGEPVTFTSDVIVDYRNSAWKFQPTTTVTGPDNANSPVTFANNRTATPNAGYIGNADLKVASFNVLNFFTTLGIDTPGCTSYKDRDGNGSTVSGGCDPRGAWDSADFARQEAKIVKAINALGADVVGLMEVENSARLGEPTDEALNTLVAALNADAGAGTWAANPSSAELPPVSEMDVINSAIIYKPAKVQRVGASRALGTQSSSGGAFDNAREPLAQVFHPVAGGDNFLFVVNHFKSKGSAGPWPGDADTGDGQGSSTESRVRQATALRDWVPTVQADSGTKAVVMVGDYNSYSQEDPLQVLYSAGYTDAEHQFNHGKYSYSFSGLSGSLDHVLMNADALKRATGADIWNINSPESVALEYSRWNYTATDFYQADPYASSDHDPVVLGLTASAPTKTVQVLGINDFHGRIQSNGVEAGAGVLAGAVKQLRGQYPDTVFAAAGDLIGASTFESFIAHDKPTLDALNSAGLEVSAVGNHEFDQGYNDLVNRVMAPYNADTNPYGGAAWQYLGDNVRHAEDHSPALPETWIKNFGDVKVGFIGAVTDHLGELVSPAGIAGLQIESPVVAANRDADKLKAQGADIVILLVHEGAETTALSSATDPNTDFGKIVTGVNDNIDAIISGHTHLSYNHSVTVPGWVAAGRPVTTRPVVSAGQYGYNLDQLLFTVDDNDKVVGLQQYTLPLVKTPAYPTDAPTQAIVDKAVSDAAVLGAQPLGQITAPFNRARTSAGAENRGGESTLGNLVAEVQQSATESATTGSAQIAFMNPGGLRADMVGSSSTYPTTLTYKQAANVQPFANTLVNEKLTGAQIKAALEQQWQPAGSSRPFLRLGMSEGFTYTYDPRAAAGSRITAMWLNGTAIDPAATYSVTVNSFLASGGDNFGAFALGANKKDTGQTDLQAMVDYMAAHKTVSPDYTQRSVGVMLPTGAPAAYYPGDQVSFDLSSLAFSTAADLKDSSVTVRLGDTVLGTFGVNNTLGTAITDEYGTASVTFALPAGLPAGTQNLRVTGDQTGTVTSVPITVGQLVSTTTTLTASAASQAYGTSSPATLTATVVQGNGGTPSGSVRFQTTGGTVLATVAVSSGTATYQVPATTPAGTSQITATFLPSAEHVTGSTSAPLTFTVNKAVTTTTLAASAASQSYGTSSPATLTATVAQGDGVSTAGDVRFETSTGTVLATVAVSSGKASYQLAANTAAGTLQITATFVPSDTANVAGSASSALTFTVSKAVSTTTLTATAGKAKGNQYQLAMTATVTLNTGKAAAGTVAFYVNGVVVAQAQVGTGGKATATAAVNKGTVQVRAQFTPADTANHLGSTSPTLAVLVK